MLAGTGAGAGGGGAGSAAVFSFEEGAGGGGGGGPAGGAGRFAQLAPAVQFRPSGSCPSVQEAVHAGSVVLQAGLCGNGNASATGGGLLTMWQQTASHLLPALMNLRHSARLAAPALISAWTQPLDSPPEYLGGQGSNINALIYFCLIISFATPLVPAVLALQHAKERESGVRLQVKLSGVSPATYWIACLAHDLVWLAATAAACLGAAAAFGGAGGDVLFQPGGADGGYGVSSALLYLLCLLDTKLVADVIAAQAKEPTRSFGTVWGSQFGAVFVFIAAGASIVLQTNVQQSGRFLITVVTGGRLLPPRRAAPRRVHAFC